MVIAVALNDAFIEQFYSLDSNYGFKNCSNKADEFYNFEFLLRRWIETSSKVIGMVQLSINYYSKKQIVTSLDAREGLDSELGMLKKNVYENTSLTKETCKTKTKLERKQVIADRDIKIEKLIKENKKLYKLYRLTKSNSNFYLYRVIFLKYIYINLLPGAAII